MYKFNKKLCSTFFKGLPSYVGVHYEVRFNSSLSTLLNVI